MDIAIKARIFMHRDLQELNTRLHKSVWISCRTVNSEWKSAHPALKLAYAELSGCPFSPAQALLFPCFMA